jgi:hypothetical protein
MTAPLILTGRLVHGLLLTGRWGLFRRNKDHLPYH